MFILRKTSNLMAANYVAPQKCPLECVNLTCDPNMENFTDLIYAW